MRNRFQVEQLVGYPWIEDEIKVFSDCARILDVGCGTGWFAEVLAETYPQARLFGMDTLNVLKFSKFQFVRASVTSLPFAPGSFDGVSCKAVLEHLWDPLRTLREICRVLVDGGILFISVPDARSKTFWDDYTHVRPYTKKSIEAMLIDAGFETQNSWYLGEFPGIGLVLRSMKVRNQKILRALGKYRINRSVLNVVARKRRRASKEWSS